MHKLDGLEVFEAEISEIRPDGVGFVQVGQDLVRVGPVEIAQGTRVDVIQPSSVNAICLHGPGVPESYIEYAKAVIKEYNLSIDIGDIFLRQGDVFSSKIESVNGSSLGRAEDPFGNILQVGPVNCNPGQPVNLVYQGGEFARVLDESIQAESYNVRFAILSSNYGEIPVEIGNVYTGTVIENFSDNSTIKVNGVHVNVDDGDLSLGQKAKLRITDFATQSAIGSVVERGELQPQDGHTDASDIVQGRDNLEALRNEALKQSRETTEPSETRTSTKQYSRSEAVKRYAKARADGECEGCGEPAPFNSKTGEPYLHVHHIHELSNGGSDKPDTVVALCPNCHYQVHHGVNGDEYNEMLRKKVQEAETEI